MIKYPSKALLYILLLVHLQACLLLLLLLNMIWPGSFQKFGSVFRNTTPLSQPTTIFPMGQCFNCTTF